MNKRTYFFFIYTLLTGSSLIIVSCLFYDAAAKILPAAASLVLAHLIADFPLQTHKIYSMKVHSTAGLVLHALVHLVVTGFVIRNPMENWLTLVLIGLVHFSLDGLKVRWKGPVLDGFLIDQALHLASLMLIATLFPVQPAILSDWLYPTLAYATLPALLMTVWVIVAEQQPGNRIQQWMRHRLIDVSQIVGLPLAAILLVLLTCIACLASCSPAQAIPTPDANMPNPASVYCEENGGRLEMRQDASGGVAGVCIFSDGSECDEWAYFRGECQPGGAPATPEPTLPAALADPSPMPGAEFAEDGCRIYRNDALGYSFHYPADAHIEPNDDPLGGISVIGPVENGETWPYFSISHAPDREEYRPPEDVDLLTWLTDHYLMGDERADDIQIAGTTAIHLRHDRSPQSYAYDRYYFARAGQLYMIVIGHSGDQEDWTLYNHFLESIQFK